MNKLYKDVERGLFDYFSYNYIRHCSDTKGKVFESAEEIKIEYNKYENLYKSKYFERYNPEIVIGFLKLYDGLFKISQKYSDRNIVYSQLFAIFRAIEEEYYTDRLRIELDDNRKMNVFDEVIDPDEIRVNFNSPVEDKMEFFENVLFSNYILGCTGTIFISLSEKVDRDKLFKEKKLYDKYDYFPKSYYLLKILYTFGDMEIQELRNKRIREIEMKQDTSLYIKKIMSSRYDRWDKIIKDLIKDLKEDLEISEYSSKDFFEKHPEVNYDAIFKFVTASPFVISFGSYAAMGGNLKQRPNS